MPPIPSTVENLKQHAAKPLAGWLIHAAKRRSSVTYGEAAQRLETEIGFATIFPPRMGVPAGEVMYRIQDVHADCPLLNILLVRQADRVPGDGAGQFMADYLGNPRLASPQYRERHPGRWRAACEEIATDVYAFEDWDQVYHDVFGQQLPSQTPKGGTEKDGINHGRRGEGKNHKALRLWVKKNPGKIKRAYKEFRAETEVVLDSADRVDVVYYGPDSSIAVEVKSVDSDESDLRRGIFQCIKYRAVMEAMDIRSGADIIAVLVTQTSLPGELADLVRLHGIRHFKAPTNLKSGS